MALALIDAQALAQIELSDYLALQSEDTAKYEVDSVDDVFGKLYRVWGGEKGINLLGTFYQALDGSWVAQHGDSRSSWRSNKQAVNAILAS